MMIHVLPEAIQEKLTIGKLTFLVIFFLQHFNYMTMVVLTVSK